jgi:hypothetical protein
MRTPIQITKRKLLVVEGHSDRKMIGSLLSDRVIPDIDVLCPSSMGGMLEGEDAIKQLLDAIAGARGFSRLERLVLLVDSDDSPQEKFKKMQDVLRATTSLNIDGGSVRYPVPDALGIFANAPSMPSVAISLLPSNDQVGAMESLCWQAGSALRQDLSACIAEFGDCVGIGKWLPQKQDKFKLRCLISSACVVNPDLPTTKLWEKVPDLVPLNSPVFDPLTAFLKGI